MSNNTADRPSRKAKTLRLYRSLPRLLSDPMSEIERIGTQSNGEIVRLGLGLARPHLVTRPDHVQHVLRENPDTYVREGVFWRPLRRFFGDSVLSSGDYWKVSRSALQPVFTARHVGSVTQRIADTIGHGVDALEAVALEGRPVDALTEMTAIVNRVILAVFFGAKITNAEGEVLGPAFETVATSIGYRFLLPFVPEALRLPGDRDFRAALAQIDEVMFDLARKDWDDQDGRDPSQDQDIFSALWRARRDSDGTLSDRWVRDNLVAIFATGTETTAVALTWLWLLLDAHPSVAARMQDEVDRVVGGDRPGPEHLADLTYTKQVIQEVLRLYPVGWVFPRMARKRMNLDGVQIKAGDPLILSPFLTQRLPSAWDRPHVFDPDRFAPDRTVKPHRYAYFPFGGGPHQCIGMHLFNVEAQLTAAAMLSRFRTEVRQEEASLLPKVGASLRPRHDVKLLLRPRLHTETKVPS